MSRFTKLWIALAALAVTALAMFAASEFAAVLMSPYALELALAAGGGAAVLMIIGSLSVGRGEPADDGVLPTFVSIGVTFFVIGIGIGAGRLHRRREARERGDRWTQLRAPHTQLAERILPLDAHELDVTRRRP